MVFHYAWYYWYWWCQAQDSWLPSYFIRYGCALKRRSTCCDVAETGEDRWRWWSYDVNSDPLIQLAFIFDSERAPYSAWVELVDMVRWSVPGYDTERSYHANVGVKCTQIHYRACSVKVPSDMLRIHKKENFTSCWSREALTALNGMILEWIWCSAGSCTKWRLSWSRYCCKNTVVVFFSGGGIITPITTVAYLRSWLMFFLFVMMKTHTWVFQNSKAQKVLFYSHTSSWWANLVYFISHTCLLMTLVMFVHIGRVYLFFPTWSLNVGFVVWE